jgi:hypothetical protein
VSKRLEVKGRLEQEPEMRAALDKIRSVFGSGAKITMIRFADGFEVRTKQDIENEVLYGIGD